MKISRLVLVFAAALPFTAAADDAADALPANLNRPLRELIVWNRAQPRALAAAERRTRLRAHFPVHAATFQLDSAATRAVVDAMLDGTQPLDAVRAALTALGAEILAAHDAPTGARGSILGLRLPLDRAVEAAGLPGVFSLTLVRAPHHRVGKTTTQGVAALKVNAVSSSYDGTGITVGVISGSYDAARDADGNRLADRAADDVASGDLPGPGNPLGHFSPVYVAAEADPSDPANDDEGRAMLQIVHDIAPGAALAFATSGATPETFAANIRLLSGNETRRCDVIVDDVGFDEEPMFFDGPIAQAIDEVVHARTMPGHPVLYYSAAGDANGAGSYSGDFQMIEDDDARAGTGAGNLKLDQVPTKLTAGGFQNFNPKAGHVTLAQRVTVHGATATLNFQWDDPWVAGLVSTDYNLLVFDKEGNYLPDLSGAENNIELGRALELVDLPPGPDKGDIVYQLVIARRGAGLRQATHLRYVVTTDGTFQAKKNTPYNAPTIIGHPAANGADAVAAYDYRHLDLPDVYTSAGPVVIYIDPFGNRLATPQVRRQPTMAAVDGVNTTFFPNAPGADTDGDGFPNFVGTSAAAPHAAGVAALLLQAAGGPGKLTDVQVRALLQNSAGAHDLDPGVCTATATGGDGTAGNTFTATITATGDDSNSSSADKTFFRVDFTGPFTSELRRIVIDLAPAREEFDPNPDAGFPFAVAKGGGTVAADAVKKIELGGSDETYPTKLTVVLAAGAFKSGGSLSFGIDRDRKATHAGGNSADLLAGATVKFSVFQGGAKAVSDGVFANTVGKGYSIVDGFGLIDAQAALAGFQASGAAIVSGGIVPVK